MIKLVETCYQNKKPVACLVNNNYTTQQWLIDIQRLQELQDKAYLTYTDELDLDKMICEREVWL